MFKNKEEEQKFLEAVENVCKSLAYRFKFSYNTIEDMRQLISLFCVDGYSRWRPEVGELQKFLYCHCFKRLINEKRDKYKRTPPCKLCANRPDGSTQHKDKKHCEAHATWAILFENRKKIIYADSIEEGFDKEDSYNYEKEMEDRVHLEEVGEIIDRKLPAYLREDYLKLKSGYPLTKSRKQTLLENIKKIVSKENVQ